MPPGKLICTRSGKYFKWYNRLDDKLLYIPKQDRCFAEVLAKKKLLNKQISFLKKERSTIQSYLTFLENEPNKIESLLSNPAFQELLAGQYNSFPEQIEKWLSEDYSRNPMFPEELTRKSISGHFLRSKSEANIDMALFMHHIPFRYEAKLVINNTTLYPDFTLLHPITHELIYWEHFGLLQDEKYRQDFVRKMDLYTANGIIPSINLITSYETAERPFTFVDAEKVLNNFFGPNTGNPMV